MEFGLKEVQFKINCLNLINKLRKFSFSIMKEEKELNVHEMDYRNPGMKPSAAEENEGEKCKN